MRLMYSNQIRLTMQTIYYHTFRLVWLNDAYLSDIMRQIIYIMFYVSHTASKWNCHLSDSIMAAIINELAAKHVTFSLQTLASCVGINIIVK